MRLAFVAARFNAEVTDLMLDRALARAKELGLNVTHVIRVPGAFEIPVAVQTLLERADVDAAVALGAVIKGETLHDEVIMGAAAQGLIDVELRTGKPVGLGITGPGMTDEQAMARIDAATRAVDAAKAMHDLLGSLR